MATRVATAVSPGTHRASSPASFVPTDVAGCILWLPSNPASFVLNGGDVSAWLDASGEGNDAAQTTAALQPTYSAAGGPNGKPGAQFIRADSTRMALTGMSDASEDYTLFVAVNLVDKTLPHQQIITTSTTGLAFNVAFTAGTIAMYDGAGWVTYGPAASQDGPQVLALEIDSAGAGSSEIFRNGASIGTGGYNKSINWASPQLGSWAPWSWSPPMHYLEGTMSTIVLFNRVLTADEKILMDAFMAEEFIP